MNNFNFIELLGNVGFPILVTTYLLIENNKTLKEVKETLISLQILIQQK